ncbi:Protein required for biogenesis of the ribosomal 60S subunit [Phaffia rhodozyma]|uniref:Ribosome production factor 2 homolog n=1 Tax=Phaffia rhodozyma TaxID=264483 RepID=A0A0F7SQP3_PHARH|nr:Protein required for biogenesis of the ribosomal 60S subunit [Phaffia rhodozyma]
MIRTVKPKNARAKRALEEREAKVVENPKTAIFVRGNQISERVGVALKELAMLKRPDSINFSKKNDIHPFESTESLEFWSSKNDASLYCVGLHSKKRPHDLVFARMFDGKVLDMMELGIEMAQGMAEFKTPKSTPGHRPLFHFASPLFETHPAMIQFKSLLLDFFNGHALEHVHLAGLEHVISITAGPLPPLPSTTSSSVSVSEASTLPIIHFRTSTIRLLHSGTRIPRMELSPMGPNFDFKIRRRQEADEDMWKQAMKKPKLDKKDVEKGLGKKRKNIETDEMGDKVGRLHMGSQDLGKLQTRKMKGLRKTSGGASEDA